MWFYPMVIAGHLVIPLHMYIFRPVYIPLPKGTGLDGKIDKKHKVHSKQFCIFGVNNYNMSSQVCQPFF